MIKKITSKNTRTIFCMSGIFKAVFFISILAAAQVCKAQMSDRRYMVQLNQNGTRIALARWQQHAGWELFEGTTEKGFSKINLPEGHLADGTIFYSPNDKNLLFTTIKNLPLPLRLRQDSKIKIETEIDEIGTLWQQPVIYKGALLAQQVISRTGSISNVLPLQDGSFVFMGKIRKLKSTSRSPIFESNRVWSEYKWMLSKPDGTITISIINQRAYAFFDMASLIRDEAVFVVQERPSDEKSTRQKMYFLDITWLAPKSDLSALESLTAGVKPMVYAPRLQCDWAGKTCAQLITFNKFNGSDSYFAHQLEIIRSGNICKIDGLPDRLEKMSISRNGNSVALITQPTPRKSGGHKLVYIEIDTNGCAASKKFFELP